MSGIIGRSPNMKSGLLGKFPSGHVLQTVQDTSETQIDVNNSQQQVIALDITNCLATSRLWVNFTVGKYIVENAATGMGIFVEITGGTQYKMADHIGYGGADTVRSFSGTVVIPASEVSAGTNNVKVTAQRVTGAGASYINKDTSIAYLTVMEIADAE